MQKKRWDLIDFCVAFITELNEKKKNITNFEKKTRFNNKYHKKATIKN